uniref:RING-type E3 ubiquitin transferase n=1 Tax=Phascolarctos cinereus TaxID=38626 RepID=A0A6P5IN21_PHACI|nr:LOW QUALITY PROTEIN: E3 ubiquitin-protein ligase makorin-1-like [Phascolarctos cinereus]
MIIKVFVKTAAEVDVWGLPDKVEPAAPKLHPPASPSPSPLADPVVNSGTVKLSNASFAAIGPGTDDWVYAIEFVPGQPYCGHFSYTCGGASQQGHVTEEESGTQSTEREPKKPEAGECPHEEGPVCLHEDSCDSCELKVPNTEDAPQRLSHIKCCNEAHEKNMELAEKDMELALAIQPSQNLLCGICMEVIYEKANPNELCFGIFTNCNHTFCLKCIRKWRDAKQFESKIIKACPECRLNSSFVIPSEFWVEEHEEKQKLIQQYKEALSSKPCRYFDGSQGSCWFGLNCFYQHAHVESACEEELQRLAKAV